MFHVNVTGFSTINAWECTLCNVVFKEKPKTSNVCNHMVVKTQVQQLFSCKSRENVAGVVKVNPAMAENSKITFSSVQKMFLQNGNDAVIEYNSREHAKLGITKVKHSYGGSNGTKHMYICVV